MTSYQVSQAHNFQSVLWAVAGIIHQTPTTLTRLSVWLSLLAQAVTSDLALWLSGLLTAVAWCVGLAAIVTAVALLLANPLVLLALGTIAAYGWATFPRKAVRKC